MVRVGALREAGVEAQLLRQLVGHAWAPAREDHLAAAPLRLHHLDELREVLHMQVLLRDRLRDEDRVGAHLDRLRHEHAVRHLAAEVVGLKAAVAL